MSNVLAFPIQSSASPAIEPYYGSGRRMLTLVELCEWLNVTERHVRKLVERNAIPYRKAGRLLRFFEPEVDEWTRPVHRSVATVIESASSTSQTTPRRKRTSSSLRLSKSLLD